MDSDEGQSSEHGLTGLDDIRIGRMLSPQNSNIGAIAESNLTGSSESCKASLKPPKVVRSRDRKFHKRFKNLPESEKVLKVYHCAYVSDILLQGYLYITADTFCFYSKILGRERQIEIPIVEVVDVTREKTAFIIPNAIGIQTSDNSKYVFGSLVSRNRTYRLISSLWKRAHMGDRSQSSAKTSSDESYFTDLEHLSQSTTSPPPAMSTYPMSPQFPLLPNTGLHRQDSDTSLRGHSARFTDSPTTGYQQSPLSIHGHHDGYGLQGFQVRRTSIYHPSTSRSPGHEHRLRHTNAECTFFHSERKSSSDGFDSLGNFLRSITPTGWWAIACTVLACILTLYGFAIFWKVLNLQTDVMLRLYQLSLAEHWRFHEDSRRYFNISNLGLEEINELINEYSLATKRLLIASKNLQEILESNTDLIRQVCKIMASKQINNKSHCNEEVKGPDCTND